MGFRWVLCYRMFLIAFAALDPPVLGILPSVQRTMIGMPVSASRSVTTAAYSYTATQVVRLTPFAGRWD